MKYHNHHLMSIRLPRPTISRAYVRGGRLSSDPLLLDSLETPQDTKTALEFAASSLVEFGNGPWLASTCDHGPNQACRIGAGWAGEFPPMVWRFVFGRQSECQTIEFE